MSIGISALTTGYTSAMIAFDKDANLDTRRRDPNFYGYIPDDHASRGKCFTLLALISALHNLSRSLGCALLAASRGVSMAVLFVGGEIVLFLVYKILRRDFMYWVRVEGPIGVVLSICCRVLVKVIVDFSGCVQVS